jgi:hypothetical protein
VIDVVGELFGEADVEDSCVCNLQSVIDFFGCLRFLCFLRSSLSKAGDWVNVLCISVGVSTLFIIEGIPSWFLDCWMLRNNEDCVSLKWSKMLMNSSQ